MEYKVILSRRAHKDLERICKSDHLPKLMQIVKKLAEDPIAYKNKKALVGDKDSKYGIRINIQHRLVYSLIEEDGIIEIHSMWGHY